MADNVYEVLLNEAPALAKRLDSNHDLCTFLQLVYNHLLDFASNQKEDPRQLVLFTDIIRERLLRIQIRYDVTKILEGELPTRAGKVAWQRNMRLVEFMRVNSDVKNLARKVVEVLELWLKEKDYRTACGFEGIRCEASTLWVNGVFTTELILKTQFDEAVRKRLGWDVEPEQPAEEPVATPVPGRIILPW